MASFWPHTASTTTTVARIPPTHARVGDRAAAHTSDDEEAEAEQAPLLPSAVVAAFAPSPDEAISVANIDEETGESHYQLLEEPEEKDGEESMTDDGPPDPAVVEESSRSLQNHTEQEDDDDMKSHHHHSAAAAATAASGARADSCNWPPPNCGTCTRAAPSCCAACPLVWPCRISCPRRWRL